MPRFFSDNISSGEIILTGEDARHISASLRMKAGENITVCSNKTDYLCRITAVSSNEVTASVLSSSPCRTEPSVFFTLYQAMPKSNKLEFIIQKAVELGVSKITPVITKRCVSIPSEENFNKKLPRYQKIALEAAKQCNRGILPEVTGLKTFDDALNEAALCDTALFLYEKAAQGFRGISLPQNGSVSLIVGSEGGYDTDEFELAKKYGIQPLWLGARILRCETAPLAALSIAMYLTNNI